jgi:hypothetical protein
MAKTRSYGSDAQLLAAFESTYGTAPDGSGGGVYTKLSFKEHALGGDKPLGYDPLLGQGRDAQDPFYEALTVDGEIVVPLDLRAIGFWLKGLFGDPDTTDNLDGTYDHVFTSGGDLPSLALQVGHTKLTTQKHFLHAGCKLESVGFDMARTGPANATIAVVAQGETSGATAADGTPLTYALKRFSQGRGQIKVGGSQLANVTGGRFSFSNNLDRVETIRSDGLIDGADETEATAEGSVEVRFSTDTTLAAAIDAETPVAMEYGYSLPGAEGYGLTIALPRVFLPRKKNEIRGPGGVQVTYDWRAAKDASAGHLCEITLVNDVESY